MRTEDPQGLRGFLLMGSAIELPHILGMRLEVEAEVLPCPSFPFLPSQSKDIGSLSNGPFLLKTWKTSEGLAWVGCGR